jgi:hypothetical protein
MFVLSQNVPSPRSARFAGAGWLVCVVVTLLAAGVAQACPSCVDPRDSARSAMLGSTIVLSLVPLAFIGAVVTWVVRRERAAGRIQAP